jgi:hypothetical protein
VLCNCVATVLTQINMGCLVYCYDLLKVSVLLQPSRELGHALAARAPLHIDLINCHASLCIKAS